MIRKAAIRAGIAALEALSTPLMRRYQESLRRPEAAQDALLAELVEGLSRTQYGAHLGVDAKASYREFCDRVPVVSYDALAPWLERQRREEGCVLVSEQVLFYEKTSGSSGPAKLIPYTASLRRSFTRMFLLWAHDLLGRGPRFEHGTFYFSVSPAFGTQQHTERGVPVGTGDDGDYLEGPVRALLSPFWVNPPGLQSLQTAEGFKDVLGAALLSTPALELVSVWNPSFFTLLLGHLETRVDSLERELREGCLVREGRAFHFRELSSDRLNAVRRGAFFEVWPHLKLLSCWTQAASQRAAQALAQRFPLVQMQGKGLLATEAPLTFPSLEAGAELPLLSEVFYELEDGEGRIHRLHEASVGETYTVLLSQRGGLCRYRLGDRVRVTGRFAQTPTLSFVGRESDTVDLVGEKLHEAFVERALEKASLPPGFRVLAPSFDVPGGPPRYVLVLERAATDLQAAARAVEAELQAGHHYRVARLLGQLGPVALVVAPSAQTLLHELLVQSGMKRGDIKDRVLLTHVERSAQFLHALAQ